MNRELKANLVKKKGQKLGKNRKNRSNLRKTDKNQELEANPILPPVRFLKLCIEHD